MVVKRSSVFGPKIYGKIDGSSDFTQGYAPHIRRTVVRVLTVGESYGAALESSCQTCGATMSVSSSGHRHCVVCNKKYIRKT